MTQPAPRPRTTLSKCLLYGALAVTLLLCWQLRPQQADSTSAVNAVQRAAVVTVNKLPIPQHAVSDAEYGLAARLPVASRTALFSQAAHPAHAAEPAGFVAATPVLPPLPFRYLGLWQQQDERKLLLESGGEVLTVSVGEKINALYQLQSIEKNAEATQINILYLPLHTIQRMTLANSGNGDYAQ